MRKADVVTAEDLENYYNKCRKIKFHTQSVPSRRQIIINSMEGGGFRSKATYYTRGGHHCEYGRYRSLDDMIKLTKFYYPESTVKQVIKELLDFKAGNITFRYCPNIRKSNFVGGNWGYGHFRKAVDYETMVNQGFPNCKITLKELLA